MLKAAERLAGEERGRKQNDPLYDDSEEIPGGVIIGVINGLLITAGIAAVLYVVVHFFKFK